MKNLHTFEEFLNEGTTPQYKRLIKRAKEEGVSTDSELYDLISDEFPDEQITGADYEEARKVLKITESAVNEAKKEKFILYTNPNNSTSAGYVAIGADDVREVLKDAKEYSDSYRILYQGSGTQEDFMKAKQMFSDYWFGSGSIE
jgi:predicted HTH transcriptional regulator